MASWKWPALANTILSDVPGVNVLLNALLKQDPAGTTDIPAGAKRWADGEDGKQFQVFNGSTWESVGKLDHDAASVDGKSASASVEPDTIPVRDADGKLPGDILGNAATASTAKALSVINPLSMGGTGAATAEEARENLVVPPRSHASAGTTYGVGSGGMYGHVKLSDYASDLYGVPEGIAATPLAVKKAQMDAVSEASTQLSSLDSTLRALIAEEVEARTAAVAGRAPTNHASAGTTYGVATGGMYGHVKLSDYASDEGLAGGVAATPLAVKKMHPAGFVLAFAGNPSSAPAGYLLCNGATVSRTTYAELFAAIGTTYGAGNGSTTFNLPNLTDKFIQGSGTAGTEKSAGLPEISGNHGRSASTFATGPFFFDDEGALGGGLSGSGGTARVIGFKASQANKIYGSSTTVQPPALTMRYYIKY